MKKTILAFILIICVMLTACAGSQTEAPKESGTQSVAPEATSGESEDAPPASEMPEEEGTATPAGEPLSEPDPDPAADPELATAYCGILSSDKGSIRNYDWQVKYTENAENPWDGTSNRNHIAIADVYGDERPELIFVVAPRNEEGYAYAGILNILTWEDGTVRNVYTERLDVLAGGGVYYALFRRHASKTPMLYISYLEEYTSTYLYEFEENGEGMLEMKEVLQEGVGPDETYERTVRETFINGAPATEEDYDAALAKQLADATSVLLYSGIYHEDVMARINELPLDAVSYDEAIDALKEMGAEGQEEDPLEGFFENIPHDYVFASGAGGWSTNLHINEDGTFEASYHDSEMGTTGEGYPQGTAYVCECTGRFEDVEWIGERCFAFRLTELNCEREEGEEWIEDGVRYVASYPYGIAESRQAQGQIFMLYFEGIETELLARDYIEWVSRPMAEDYFSEMVMPITGLFNTADRTGFFAAPEE